MFNSHPSYEEDVDDYYAFSKLVGENMAVDTLISSPYREDKTPSFIIRRSAMGNLFFTDYGSGDTGNWFELYKLMYHGTYKQAIKFLGSEVFIKPHKLQRGIKKEKPIRKGELFSLKIIETPWNSELLNYWRQFNISYYTLRRYNVTCIKAYKREDYPVKHVYGYSYELGEGQRKILIPNAYKLSKWMVNTTAIQGAAQLDLSNDIIIITKSLKDVMLFDELNYSSIAPQSETSPIEKDYMDYLKSNFESIYVLFDNDAAGIIASNKFIEKYDSYNVKNLVLPKALGKDISEVSKNYGLNVASKVVEILLINK